MFPGVRNAYTPDPSYPNHAGSSTLVELTAPGDHISFEVDRESEFSATVAPRTLRNWTLEHRIGGCSRDVTPDRGQLPGAPVQLT